jgi:microcompartment protein CcmK/EutM
MILGTVVGRVSCVQKVDTLRGLNLVIVQPLGADGKKMGTITIAVDPLGVGRGQNVLMVTGGAATRTLQTRGVETVVDAAIVSIVDSFDISTPEK